MTFRSKKTRNLGERNINRDGGGKASLKGQSLQILT